MRLEQHPELLQRIAASYALGTLRAGARRRFETLAREHPAVRAAGLLWQTHWAGLTELQPSEQPPAVVWTRIDNLIQAERAALQQRVRRADAQALVGVPAPWWRSLGLWRGATALGAFATVTAVVIGLQVTQGLQQSRQQQVASLQAQIDRRAPTPTSYVAVLRDDKAAALLVTYDVGAEQLQLQRVGGFDVPPDRSLQLWALPTGGQPRSLGVLTGARSEALIADAGQLQGVPALALSLEAKGGVPSEGGPKGPVLFTGEWIQKTT